MTPTQWKSLLNAWSAQLLKTDLTRHLKPSERTLRYLGFLPASKSTIATLESRLGVTLPPSYRAFLAATNGFRVISPFTYGLRAAADVDWFHVENQGWIEIFNEPSIYDNPDRPEPTDEEYFDYSNPNDHDSRSSHLFTMLQISEVDDGVMLLNPQAVTPDGEWEAWFFANWIPGAYRYPSFAHMMVQTYRSMRELERLPRAPKLPTLKIPSPKVPRRSVITIPAPYEPERPHPKRNKGQSRLKFIAEVMAEFDQEVKAPAPPELVSLLHTLKVPDKKARAKSIRILQGKLKGRQMTTRHPDLVPLATEMARSLPDPEARSVCVSLLEAITPDGPVPEWLPTALHDSHPWVQMAGLHAVYYFKGPELVAPIIKILAAATDLLLAQSASTALAEIADKRAIPSLAAQLAHTHPADPPVPPQVLKQFLEQFYTKAALDLASFGPPAVRRLTPFLLHTDRNRRLAAIVALRAIGDPTSRAAVAELKSDPDPEVRRQAELCDRMWGTKSK